MVINQGDIFWIDFGTPKGRTLSYRHPYVVVQGNPYNHSKMGTTVVCGVTSNLKRAHYPGNVLLEKGEGNLPKESVVNISQLYTVDKQLLRERIGTLVQSRINEINQGIRLLLDSEEVTTTT